MSIMSVINDDISVICNNRLNINTNMGTNYRSTGATGPTGPTGPQMQIGDVTTKVNAYDKIVSTTTGDTIYLDNTAKYRQVTITSLIDKINQKQK